MYLINSKSFKRNQPFSIKLKIVFFVASFFSVESCLRTARHRNVQRQAVCKGKDKEYNLTSSILFASYFYKQV